MKNSISKWGLDNSRLVKLLVTILLLGGLYAYYDIPKLEDPEIIVRQALVVGTYPGASAHRIELEVADPLEKSIRETSGVDFIETRCYADYCILKVSLLTTVRQDDLQKVWDRMRDNIDKSVLPDGTDVSVHDDFGDVFGMFYCISGNDFSARELSDYAYMLQRELQTVDGIGHISFFGMPRECIRINIRADRLAELGVLPVEIIQTLRSHDASVYSGYLEGGGNRLRVAVDDRFESEKDIEDLIITGHGQKQLKLSDIADIVREESSPVREYMEYEGERAIGLSISAISGSDIVKVGRRVERKLKELKAERIPEGISMEPVFSQPDRVSDALKSFMLNLLFSVALVILILIFTMGWRAGLIIGATLVTTVAGSIFILYYTGGTLQRISLCSFVMAMGMLVDNAIVVTDGILRDRAAGVPVSEALTATGRRTAWSLLSATLIAILAFLPIFMSPDVTGIYVHDMFIVLTVSLLLSWILALVLVPVMAEKMFFGHDSGIIGVQRDSGLYRYFCHLLDVILNHRRTSIAIAVLLTVLAGFGALKMPRALFPDMEYDQVYMEYKLPEGRSQQQVKSDLDSICRWLKGNDDVRRVFLITGGTPTRYNLVRSIHAPSLSYGELIIDFSSSKKARKNLPSLQKSVTELFPDAYIRFKRYNLMFMQYPIQLVISGPDPAVLTGIREDCMNAFTSAGVCDGITDEWEAETPTLSVGYSQSKSRQTGLSRTEVAMSLLATTEGLPVGRYYDGTYPLDIFVNCVAHDGRPVSDLNDATVFGVSPDISGILSSDLGDILAQDRSIEALSTRSSTLRQATDGIEISWEAPVVCRYNGVRTRTICAFPADGESTESARLAVARNLRDIQLPEGYRIDWNGEKLAETMSMENLFHFYPLALGLILLILLIQYRSYRTIGIILLSLPVVIIGVVPAVLLSGMSFGFIPIVGVLGLTGMIIKNEMILIDEIYARQADGLKLKDAVAQAARSRFRPVTMAALTTVLGMTPLLGDSMFRAMAAAMIGGLLVGTITILLLVPVLFSLIHSDRR